LISLNLKYLTHGDPNLAKMH